MKRTPFLPKEGKVWKGIRPISVKKRRQDRVFRANRDEVFKEADGLCQISKTAIRENPEHEGAYQLSKICLWYASDGHHVLPRSQGGSNQKENIMPGCRPCHDWIKAHPKEAFEVGVLKHTP